MRAYSQFANSQKSWIERIYCTNVEIIKQHYFAWFFGYEKITISFCFSTVLAISVLEDQSLDNLQLDPSFPLKLRQTQFGRILNKIRLPDQVLRENAYRGLIKSVFFEYKTLHNLLWSAEKYIPREDISGIINYIIKKISTLI